MKWFLRIVLAAFCVIPTIFLVIGFSMVFSQASQINTFVPVDAVVLSTEVKVRRGDDSTTYTPIVKYRYAVAGKEYEGDDVYPLSISAGKGWAYETIEKFSEGQTVTAYHDPGDPHEAFLIPEYSYFPYIFTQFPMLFLMVAAMVWIFASRGGRKVTPPERSEVGGYRLQPVMSLKSRRRMVFLLAIFWYGMGAFSAGHYLLSASKYETIAYIFVPIYLAFGLIPAGVWVHSLRLSWVVEEPLVMTGKNEYRLGGEVAALVVLPIKSTVTINELTITLKCDQSTRTKSGSKTSYSTNTCYEQTASVADAQQAHAGERVSGSHTFEIPASESATKSKGYPMYDWYLEAHLDIADRPDYKGKFPIEVLG